MLNLKREFFAATERTFRFAGLNASFENARTFRFADYKEAKRRATGDSMDAYEVML